MPPCRTPTNSRLTEAARPKKNRLTTAGTLVLYSISTSGITKQLDNFAAIRAVENLPRRKYLGIVSYRSLPGPDSLGDRVYVCPVVTSLPSPAMLDEICEYDPDPHLRELYAGAYLSLDASVVRPRKREGTRPILHPTPRLPWKDAFVFTALDENVAVEKVFQHRSARDVVQINKRELKLLGDICAQDTDAIDRYGISRPVEMSPEAREDADRWWDRYMREGHDSLTPSEHGSPDPAEYHWERNLGELIDIWEDISQIREVPDPLLFEEEFEEVKRLIRKCYDENPRETKRVKEWAEGADASMTENSPQDLVVAQPAEANGHDEDGGLLDAD